MHLDPQIFMFASLPVPVLKLWKLDIPEYKIGLSDFSSLIKFEHNIRMVHHSKYPMGEKRGEELEATMG
jgi:hypothetical protein